MATKQRIIDLDEAVPEDLGVKVDGQIYDLPGDIPIPRYLEIERLVDRLDDPEQADGQGLKRLYEQILDLFRVRQPDLEELPIGPRRLGALVVQLYSQAADGDGGEEERPTRAGTRSTSRKTGRSRGSRS
jgi:hypothetical protein